MSKYRADVPTVIGNPARIIAKPETRRWIYGIAGGVVPLRPGRILSDQG